MDNKAGYRLASCQGEPMNIEKLVQATGYLLKKYDNRRLNYTKLIKELYLALCLLVGRWAQSLKRSGNAYMFLSIFFTPLLMAIILAFAGINKKAIEAEKAAVNRRRLEKERQIKEKNEKINNTWKDLLKQNGFSEYIELFEKNKLDNADVLLALTEQDLGTMGINAIGDRKRIIQILKDTGDIKENKTDDLNNVPKIALEMNEDVNGNKDKFIKDENIWICSNCGKKNKYELLFCAKCKKQRRI
jgi:predicted membrane protein